MSLIYNMGYSSEEKTNKPIFYHDRDNANINKTSIHFASVDSENQTNDMGQK